MKVKLFSKNDPLRRKGKNQLDLENEINVWLEENPTIKVVDIKQSASGGSFNPPTLFISLWYEESA